MSNFAWVTLTTNDTYSLGALVLAHSLKRVGTAHQLAVLVTPGVSEAMRQKLKDVYHLVQDVNVMDSQDAANLALLARPELGVTFTKLHCWRLTQYEKCVFLDSDTLVLQNCDELFEREELSAAPDVSWPDCFNSGVFVYKPSLDTFGKITEFALKNGSFDGGDQGLLNQYFADWAHTDIKKHLPFVYNVTAYASYCYLPAFKQFKDKIKILHFAGKLKPWLIQFNSASKTACTPTDYAHAHDLIQLWWNIFCDNVHPSLTDSMNESNAYWCQFLLWMFVTNNNNNTYDSHTQNNHYTYHLPHAEHESNLISNEPRTHYHTRYFDLDVKEYRDPWEDYYEKLAKQSQEHEQINQQVQQQQSHEEIEQQQQQQQQQILEPQKEANEKEEEEEVHPDMHEPQVHQHFDAANLASERHTVVAQAEPSGEHPLEAAESNRPQDASSRASEAEYEEVHRHNDRSSVGPDVAAGTHEQVPQEPQGQEEGQEAEEESGEEEETEEEEEIVVVVEEEEEEEAEDKEAEEAGLAGALSQLRLGVQRTPEQEAYEALMRRQCWESGQIDYAGKDSFDNIWKRIQQTLQDKPTASASQAQDADKSGSS